MLDAPDGNPQYVDPEEEKNLPSLTNPAYQNRPSIGQRIGGARSPSDSATPVADGTKVRSPEVADVVQGSKPVPALASETRGMGRPRPAADVQAPSFADVMGGQPAPANRPSQLPAATGNVQAPSFDTVFGSNPTPAAPPASLERPAPSRMNLLQMGEQTYGKPTDPRAVGPNGKPMYRMGIGQRIAGTAANFLNGFARNGQPVVNVGPGATNSRFDTDEAMRTKNLANIKEQIGTELGAEKEESRANLQEAQAERQRSQGEGYQSRAENAEKTLAEKTREFDEKLNATKDKPSVIADAVGDRQKVADQQGLKGSERRDYILTGKLPKEFAPKDAGGTKDSAEAIKIATHRGTEHDKVDRAREEERSKRYSEIDKNIRVMGNFNAKANADAKAKVDAELETRYSARHKQVDDDADAMLGLTKSGGALKKGGTPAGGAKISPDEAKTYLTKSGWDGKTPPTPAQKDKARQLAKADKKSF